MGEAERDVLRKMRGEDKMSVPRRKKSIIEELEEENDPEFIPFGSGEDSGEEMDL